MAADEPDSSQTGKDMSWLPGGPGDRERKVRVGVFTGIAALLRSLDVDPEPVFKRAGFEVHQFKDPDHRMPYFQMTQLLAECAESSGCAHFGLLVGQALPSSNYGVMGDSFRAAADVETALKGLIGHFDLHDDGGTPLFSVGPKLTLLGYSVNHPGAAAIEQVYDLSTAFIYNLMQELCGATWRPSRVFLARRRPADTRPYVDFFKSMPQFDAEMSAVAFPSHWLRHAVPSADEILSRQLQLKIAEMRFLQQPELVDLLSQHVRLGLLKGNWSAREIALSMGLNEHTLRRRLKAQGTSFRQQVDEVRQSLSTQLLEATSITVEELTGLMGYTYPSAFVRAFHRWTGTTPNEWRKSRH